MCRIYSYGRGKGEYVRFCTAALHVVPGTKVVITRGNRRLIETRVCAKKRERMREELAARLEGIE